ncbi:MAG: acyl carrier protein [Colwellia sp.]|nr:acyl carrier protein [Colwellia sp.]
MEYAVVVVIVLVVISLFIKKDDKNRKVEIGKIFEGRKKLTPVEFYEKYYSDKGIPKYIILDILNLLEDELEADLSQLEPDDDFSKNLRYLFEFDSMADVEVIESIESKFSIKISDSEAENIKTINDLVLFVNNRVSCT